VGMFLRVRCREVRRSLYVHSLSDEWKLRTSALGGPGDEFSESHQMSSAWIAMAIFRARVGGTAFPTWWYCSVRGPQKR